MSENVSVKGIADVVFLVDCTGSMKPCLDALKAKISGLADCLSGGNMGSVDWRAKVVGYRDLEADSTSDQFVGKDNPFISDEASLQAQVAPLTHSGGGAGAAEIPESALDAISLAMNMTDWRAVGTSHRIIVLLTDAPTKPVTVDGKSIQDLAPSIGTGHYKLLVYGPKCTEYDQLGKAPGSTFQDVSAGAGSADVYLGLKNVDWNKVFELIGKTVSQPVPASAPAAPSTPTPAASTSVTSPEDAAAMAPAPDSADGPMAPPPGPSAGSGGKTIEA